MTKATHSRFLHINNLSKLTTDNSVNVHTNTDVFMKLKKSCKISSKKINKEIPYDDKAKIKGRLIIIVKIDKNYS